MKKRRRVLTSCSIFTSPSTLQRPLGKLLSLRGRRIEWWRLTVRGRGRRPGSGINEWSKGWWRERRSLSAGWRMEDQMKGSFPRQRATASHREGRQMSAVRETPLPTPDLLLKYYIQLRENTTGAHKHKCEGRETAYSSGESMSPNLSTKICLKLISKLQIFPMTCYNFIKV